MHPNPDPTLTSILCKTRTLVPHFISSVRNTKLRLVDGNHATQITNFHGIRNLRRFGRFYNGYSKETWKVRSSRGLCIHYLWLLHASEHNHHLSDDDRLRYMPSLASGCLLQVDIDVLIRGPSISLRVEPRTGGEKGEHRC